MQLGVLVDRALDGDEQPRLVQRLQVLVQIGIAFFHSTVMFFSRMILAHFACSLRTRRPRSSGVPATISQPCASKRSRTAASEKSFVIAPCSCSITAFGVAAGATIATQDSVSNPG